MHDAGVQALACLLFAVALSFWAAGWKGRGIWDAWQARRDRARWFRERGQMAMERMRREAQARPTFLNWEAEA